MFERHRQQQPTSPVHVGMVAYSADGYRLGRVIRVEADGFQIERGTFFRHDGSARLRDVKEIKGSEIYLSHRREALMRNGPEREREPAREARTEAAELRDRSAMGEHFGEAASPLPEPHTERRELLGRDLGREELRIPLASEELEVVKRENPKVAARIHKRVVTEIRELKVPIRREELVIEKVPISAAQVEGGQVEFKEDRFVIPLVEEEIEIRKHLRVSEQVVIRKQSTTEERHLREPVRREVVEVERQAELSRASGGHPAPPQPPPAGGYRH